ncbi:hypothetical protein BJ508DRAFT_415548 [Ascobolus immersus RN42]|uniref:Uncharacterized protein n=1 Tax=Ascobolus immersus RN42 TaxID=1160509 RepID=A0A3N4I793_ASCIM|nr:hypothetical protein BJ508DRAFT_415548 [Ascobolus immersus RN42]
MQGFAAGIARYLLKPMSQNSDDVPEPLVIDDCSIMQLGHHLPTSMVDNVNAFMRAIADYRRPRTLERDGFQCCITKQKCSREGQSTSERSEQPIQVHLCNLRVGYIIPQSDRDFEPEVTKETEEARALSSRLFRLLFPDAHDRLERDNARHKFPNLITLEEKVHEEFGNFRIGLRPLQEKHVYKLLNYSPIRFEINNAEIQTHEAASGETEIALSDHSSEYETHEKPERSPLVIRGFYPEPELGVMLPDASLLKAHASCVEMLNRSGHAGLVRRMTDEEAQVIEEL